MRQLWVHLNLNPPLTFETTSTVWSFVSLTKLFLNLNAKAMLKGTINYISKSGKSALIAVTTTNGIFKQRVSGFVECETKDLKVGQEIEMPFSKAHTEKTEIEGRVFDKLILS